MFVRRYDVTAVRLHHQQGLAQRSGALSKHVLRVERDDRCQREDEVVDVRLVQVIGGDSIGHGIRGLFVCLYVCM